jgi:site-specific DNA recombinase
MRNAQPQPDAELAMARWRRVIQESDAKLRQYRATLDAGADPAVVTGWIAHTQAERNQAEQQMETPHPAAGRPATSPTPRSGNWSPH